MRKIAFAVFAVMCMVANPVSGQTGKTAKKKTLKENMDSIWNQMKSDATDASQKVRGALGFEDRHVDETKIDGTYYMPVYSVNLYKKEDGQSLKLACEKAFKARYPQAVIMTEAIPQEDWLTESVKKEKVVVGYSETLYCYILAKDGAEGYINAKFVFQRYKKVGGSYAPVAGKWPSWERTDAVPNAVYKQLTDNSKNQEESK